MKILQIATQVPVPQTDGGKKSVFGVTKYLNLLGHEVDFVCYRRNDDYNYSYAELSKVCNPHILDVQTNNSILKAFLNLFSPVPYNVSKYKTHTLKKYLIKLLKKKHFDIIQVEHSHLGWLASILRCHTKVPIIIRAQNLELRIMERFYKNQKNIFLKIFSKMQYKKALIYEPNIYSKFDLCIMISQKDQEDLLKLNPNSNTTVIPAGIEKDLLKHIKKDIIPYSIVHIGHTDWYPNYDGLNWFVNNVFPIILKRYPDVLLSIYGGGSTKEFPIPVNLKDNVKVIGYVEDLWTELQNKALAIVPLRIGGGIRIKILELLATGQTIISTTIGKEGIDIKNRQHLLIADDVDTFIQQIQEVFENKINTETLRINGKKFIEENYIWQSVAKKFEAKYYDLLNSI